MDLSGIWAECGRLLSDRNNDRWSQDILTTRANLAQTEIVGQTSCIKEVANYTPQANASNVTVDADIIDIIRAEITNANGETIPLQGISREQLDFLYPNWQQWQAGQPLLWWYDQTSNILHLQPSPDANAAITNALRLWEVKVPNALSASTDIPFNSYTPLVPYHMSIVHWVVAQCFMDDGTPEALAKARFHKSGSMLNPGEYEKEIGRIMAEFDSPSAIPGQVLFRPQGGRIGTWYVPSKSYPLLY